MVNPFDLSAWIERALRPLNSIMPKDIGVDGESAIKQFYCHGCNKWFPCKNSFDPYDCPGCGQSRWGD